MQLIATFDLGTPLRFNNKALREGDTLRYLPAFFFIRVRRSLFS